MRLRIKATSAVAAFAGILDSGTIWHLDGQLFDNKASSIRVIQA